MLLLWDIRKTVFNADNIKSSNMVTEEMYEIEIPIIIEKNSATYEYEYGHLESSEMLKWKRELKNEVDKHAVAIMRSNSLGKELVIGHIPQNISKFSSMFFMFPFTSIKVEPWR